METLRIEQTDDSPQVILDQEDSQFEISGKSLPEDVVEFYQPVLNWINEYRKNPLASTEFNMKLTYFNTASSKLIMDIFLILEEMVEEGHKVLIRWHSLRSDEDMQEAGKEFDEMIDIPFEHAIYEK
jgi:SiaC family regulatory phosphoprotein